MPLTTQSAPRPILHGRFAEAAIGGVVVANCFEREVEVETETADVTAFGDVWKFNAPLASGWTFLAKQYVIPPSASHTINTLYYSAAVPSQFTDAGYSSS